MKRNFFTLLAAALIGVSCSTSNDPFEDPGIPGGEIPSTGDDNSGTGTSSSTTVDLGVLNSFTVELNTAPLSETETIPTSEDDPYYNEYVENNFSEKNVTKITFNGSTATVTGQVSGDEYSIDGAHVVFTATSKGLTLEVSGSTTNGSLKIYSDKKFHMQLNNASITNPSGAAINIQNGNCFVTLVGTNTLSDGSSAAYESGDEDMKAVFFSEDDLRFGGTGTLIVNANNTIGKSGISCDDGIFIRPNTNIQITSGSSAGHGMKANDAIVIKGGVQNIQVAAAGKKALSSDLVMEIAGGRTTAITTGGVDTSDSTDPTGSACIKTDSILTISGGELYLKSTGQGGKGISSDEDINISGGTLYIITSGSMYSGSSSSQGGGKGGWGGFGGNSSSSDNSVSPKGIRGDKNINISGGTIYVRTTGGTNAESIESKANLNFSGGYTAVSAYDDGLNAATSINISGGWVFSISTGNCDGIDSNGSFSSTGGVMVCVASTTNSEDGLDAETTKTFNGGTVIALCNGSSGMNSGKFSGHYVKTTVTGNSGSYVVLTKDSSPLIVFTLPRTYSKGELILAHSSLTSGSYTLQTGVTPTGGTLWMNYYHGATGVSGGTSSNVTAN